MEHKSRHITIVSRLSAGQCSPSILFGLAKKEEKENLVSLLSFANECRRGARQSRVTRPDLPVFPRSWHIRTCSLRCLDPRSHEHSTKSMTACVRHRTLAKEKCKTAGYSISTRVQMSACRKSTQATSWQFARNSLTKVRFIYLPHISHCRYNETKMLCSRRLCVSMLNQPRAISCLACSPCDCQ